VGPGFVPDTGNVAGPGARFARPHITDHEASLLVTAQGGGVSLPVAIFFGVNPCCTISISTLLLDEFVDSILKLFECVELRRHNQLQKRETNGAR
jgi:hypothetical protein